MKETAHVPIAIELAIRTKNVVMSKEEKKESLKKKTMQQYIKTHQPALKLASTHGAAEEMSDITPCWK